MGCHYRPEGRLPACVDPPTVSSSVGFRLLSDPLQVLPFFCWTRLRVFTRIVSMVILPSSSGYSPLFISWTFDLWRVPGIFSSLSYAPLFRCLRYSDSVSVIFILLLPTRGLRRTWAPFRFSLSSCAPSRSQDSCPSFLLSRVDSLRDGLRLSLANISMAFGPI